MRGDERLDRLARVVEHAVFVWSDRDDAWLWLRTAHPELGDCRPLDLALDSDEGAQRVDELLDGILHGLPA